VSSGNEEPVAANDGRGNLSDAAEGVLGVLPEELAGVGVNADGAGLLAENEDVGGNRANGHFHGGAVAGAAADIAHRRRPDDVAVGDFEGRNRGLARTRSANDFLAIDEDRIVVTPGGGSAAEVLHVTLLPLHLAVSGVELGDHAVRIADGVNLAVRIRGSAARSNVLVGFPAHVDGREPELLAVSFVECPDAVFPVATTHAEDFAGGDRGCGEAGAKPLRGPELGRAVLGPAFQESRLGRFTVPVLPAPLWPVVRARLVGGQRDSRDKHGRRQKHCTNGHGAASPKKMSWGGRWDARTQFTAAKRSCKRRRRSVPQAATVAAVATVHHTSSSFSASGDQSKFARTTRRPFSAWS